ncbi:hypothetical protein PPTG_01716 [Phytophthora nicotianae INRA-310]|uniref:Chromo domain-containing protein n=1 Tax=Phytophthora nicotianae (strain INRA-310) TaxID=761204 RepID=W2RA37_PHYN3|nr:hypothetical protein PPTG_01716 [Phytophthora nicotianae INRA-310]ETN21569.1 hypothetical protein PPTG_01716 [Phytophthora nicotianae INRA-310]
MITEYKISHNDWIYLVPLVQANLNHSPVASLANKAPVEVFTGLPCPVPAYILHVPDNQPKAVSISSAAIENTLAKLRSSIEDMYCAVKNKRENITLLNKRKSRDTKEVTFSVDDYVLRSRVDERRHNKLLVTWIGLYVVTRADSHSFRVRHLVTGKEQDDIVLKVDRLSKHRWNKHKHAFEILVSWCGLEPIEDSWEPLKSLAQNIPALLRTYVEAAEDAKLATALQKVTST